MNKPKFGRIRSVDLWYPDQEDLSDDYPTEQWSRYDKPEQNCETIEVELIHVRAADAIRIMYDFERDGYVIFQSDQDEDESGNGNWSEVAFVKAWQLEKDEE